MEVQGRNEMQDQPLLILPTTYALNFSACKQITIGNCADENFAVKIIFSHLKVPSRHLEMTLEDFAQFRTHFPLFTDLFNTNDTDVSLMKTFEHPSFVLVLENMYGNATVSMISRRCSAKFSFQKSVFETIVWLMNNIQLAIENSMHNQNLLVAANLEYESNPDDPRLKQALSEMKTYNCLTRS